MVDIMTHIHRYVPSIPLTGQIKLTTGECVDVTWRRMGGDQMTAARGRSAVNAKANELGRLAYQSIPKLIFSE